MTAQHRSHRFVRRLAACVAVALCGVPTASTAQAMTPQRATLRVLSSNGVRAPLETVRAALEADTGYALDFQFSTAADLTERIEGGEAFDVAILTPALLDRLTADGRIAAVPRRPVARTGVGIGALRGHQPVTVETPAQLAAVLRASDSIAFTAAGQSRAAIDAAFEYLEITEYMLRKSLILGPGEAPIAVVAGEAELVLTLISEILPVAGLELIAPFPEALQIYVTFEAGIRPGGGRVGAEPRRFLKALGAQAMSAALRHHGLEPVEE